MWVAQQRLLLTHSFIHVSLPPHPLYSSSAIPCFFKWWELLEKERKAPSTNLFFLQLAFLLSLLLILSSSLFSLLLPTFFSPILPVSLSWRASVFLEAVSHGSVAPQPDYSLPILLLWNEKRSKNERRERNSGTKRERNKEEEKDSVSNSNKYNSVKKVIEAEKAEYKTSGGFRVSPGPLSSGQVLFTTFFTYSYYFFIHNFFLLPCRESN